MHSSLFYRACRRVTRLPGRRASAVLGIAVSAALILPVSAATAAPVSAGARAAGAALVSNPASLVNPFIAELQRGLLVRCGGDGGGQGAGLRVVEQPSC